MLTLYHSGFSTCSYIEDAFPERPLRPENPKRRWKMRHWMRFR